MKRLQPIVGPLTNYSAPDEAVAQSIAQSARWQFEDATGAIYDEDGGYLAADLGELTAAMDALGWFVRARATGPNWHNIPHDDEAKGARLRGAVQHLRHR